MSSPPRSRPVPPGVPSKLASDLSSVSLIASSDAKILTPSLWLLCGQISSDSIASVIQAAELFRDQTPRLLIDSIGGDHDGAIGLYSYLATACTDLETCALGKCYSAAVFVLQAGRVRLAYPYASFFTHACSVTEEPLTPARSEAVAAGLRLSETNAASMLHRRTGRRTLRYWRDFFKSDRYFDSREAQSLGLIDHIL